MIYHGQRLVCFIYIQTTKCQWLRKKALIQIRSFLITILFFAFRGKNKSVTRAYFLLNSVCQNHLITCGLEQGETRMVSLGRFMAMYTDFKIVLTIKDIFFRLLACLQNQNGQFIILQTLLAGLSAWRAVCGLRAGRCPGLF